MGHAQHVRVVPRQLALEKALLHADSDEHERERDARDEDCEVRLEPQPEADEDQRIRGVERVTNDAVRSGVRDGVRALALQADDSDGKCIRPKRERSNAVVTRAPAGPL